MACSPTADGRVSRLQAAEALAEPVPTAAARRFGARAAQYHERALLQRQTAQTLAAFIAEHGGLPRGLVAEVGCGTGLLTELLLPSASAYLATDIAPEMTGQCRQRLGHLPGLHFAVRDGEQAAFPEAPAAIVSNLAAQWFANPAAGLARLAEASPALAFSVPLRGSFPEWERAFADMGRASGLLPLPEEAALRAALCALPGRNAVFKVERHMLRYANARAFVESFRGIGADTPRPGYRPGFIRPVLRRFATGMDATALVLYAIVRREGA